MYFNFFKRTNTVCVLRFSIIARDQLQNRVTIMSIPYLRLSFYLFLHMPTSYQLSLSLKHNASQANIQRDMPCLNNAKHLDKICHCSHTIKSEIHRYIANVNGRLNMIYRTRLKFWVRVWISHNVISLSSKGENNWLWSPKILLQESLFSWCKGCTYK